MLQVNFIMICIIHKMLAFLNITTIFKLPLRRIIDFYFLKNNYFSQHIMIERPNLEKGKIIKGARNIFRLEKLKNKQLIPQLKT